LSGLETVSSAKKVYSSELLSSSGACPLAQISPFLKQDLRHLSTKERQIYIKESIKHRAQIRARVRFFRDMERAVPHYNIYKNEVKNPLGLYAWYSLKVGGLLPSPILRRQNIERWNEELQDYEEEDLKNRLQERSKSQYDLVMNNRAESLFTVEVYGKKRVKLINRLGQLRPEGSGGKREKSTHFTMSSRKSLEEKLYRVDWEKYPKLKQTVFVTLTYPNEHDLTKEQTKRDLDVFIKRIMRKYSGTGGFWKMEFQRNTQQPHYHLILLFKKDIGKITEFRKWVAESWFKIIETDNEDVLRVGTSADPRKKGAIEMIYYMVNYITGNEKIRKDKSYQERVPERYKAMGRWWGIISKKNIEWLEVQEKSLSYDQYKGLLSSIHMYFSDDIKKYFEKKGKKYYMRDVKFHMSKIVCNLLEDEDLKKIIPSNIIQSEVENQLNQYLKWGDVVPF
jgi:hypothetical protein